MPTPKEVAESILSAFKDHLARALGPVAQRLGQLEQQLKELPAPSSMDPELVRTAVAAEVSTQVEKLPKPKDGKDVDEAVLKEAVTAEVARQVAALPKPQDGKSVDLEGLNASIRKLIDEAASKIPPPKDGDPGRDALAIEVLPSIDPTRSYGRGTYASYRGGVVRAARTTDYLDDLKDGETVETKGWQIILSGIAETQLEVINERNVVLRMVETNGRVREQKIALPTIIDRGVYRHGHKYESGDAVSFGGSLWIAQVDEPKGKPGDADSGWRLSVKKGRDA